jgi:hypothetical protein
MSMENLVTTKHLFAVAAMPEQEGEHCAGSWYFFEIPACLRTLAPQADPHTDIATNLLDEGISQYKGVGEFWGNGLSGRRGAALRS